MMGDLRSSRRGGLSSVICRPVAKMNPKTLPALFLKNEARVGNEFAPSRSQAHKLKNVLRLPDGARIKGLLPNGVSAELQLNYDKRGRARLLVKSVSQEPVQETSGLTVALSLIKRVSQVDFVIEKGTEIGVSAWWAVETARCADIGLVRSYAGRMDRWKRIVESAVLQSGRSTVPQVGGIFSFEEFLLATRRFTYKAVGDPNAAVAGNVWNPKQGPGLFLTGPEGGLTAGEQDALRQEGFVSYRLGPNILRSETAALVGAIMLLLGVDT